MSIQLLEVLGGGAGEVAPKGRDNSHDASKQPDDECVRVSFRETKQPALPSNVAEQPVLVYLCEGSAFKHFLTLRPSTIEGAGLGLFTAVKLYAGDVITRYVGPPKGPKKNTMEFNGRLHCPSACFPYGFAHFINEQAKRSDRGANVCNVVTHKDGTIVAPRAGSQICCAETGSLVPTSAAACMAQSVPYKHVRYERAHKEQK